MWDFQIDIKPFAYYGGKSDQQPVDEQFIELKKVAGECKHYQNSQSKASSDYPSWQGGKIDRGQDTQDEESQQYSERKQIESE